MKTFGNFAEDLDTRRQELKQRQQQQLGRFKQKGADVNQAAAQRSASQRDKAEKLLKEQQQQEMLSSKGDKQQQLQEQKLRQRKKNVKISQQR